MKDLYNENFLSASFHSNPGGGGNHKISMQRQNTPKTQINPDQTE